MCLTLDKEVTRRLDFELAAQNTIVAYKVVSVWDFDFTMDLKSQFQRALYSPGYIESDRGGLPRTVTLDEFYLNVIDHGIHVYVNHKDAKRYIYNDDGIRFLSCVILPVACHYGDFVAAGYFGEGIESAVFSRVKVTKLDYDKAQQEAIMMQAGYSLRHPEQSGPHWSYAGGIGGEPFSHKKMKTSQIYRVQPLKPFPMFLKAARKK